MAICTPPELRERRAVDGAALCASPQKYHPLTFVSRMSGGPLALENLRVPAGGGAAGPGYPD